MLVNQLLDKNNKTSNNKVNETCMKTAIKNVHFLTLIECALFKSIHETHHDQVAILGRLHLQSAGIFCNTK